MKHIIVQRTETTGSTGAKSLFSAKIAHGLRRRKGSLALLALLVAGPMVMQPPTHSSATIQASHHSGSLSQATHHASIVDDIVDVIDEIIKDLTGGGNGGGRTP